MVFIVCEPETGENEEKCVFIDLKPTLIFIQSWKEKDL